MPKKKGNEKIIQLINEYAQLCAERRYFKEFMPKSRLKRLRQLERLTGV